MEQGHIPNSPPTLQSPLNSLLVGLGLLFIGFFVASSLGSLLLTAMPGWQAAYEAFIEGRRSDETACMVYRWIGGLLLFCSFALPAILWAGMHGKPFELLKLKGAPQINLVLVGSIAMIAALPLIEAMAIPVNSFHLPESMKATEQWLKEQNIDSMLPIQYLLSDISGPGLVSNLFFIALVPAIAEEFFFRGFLQQAFLRLMRPSLAIPLTAAAFSLMHLQFLVFFPRFVLGMMLGYFFYRSGKLSVTIVAHFAYNAFTILLAYFSAQGILSPEIMSDSFSFPLWAVVISAALTFGLVLLFKNKSVVTSEPSLLTDTGSNYTSEN